MKYYKTVDENGKLIRLDKSTTKASGIEISETEYNLLYAAINIEINGIPISELAEEVK